MLFADPKSPDAGSPIAAARRARGTWIACMSPRVPDSRVPAGAERGSPRATAWAVRGGEPRGLTRYAARSENFVLVVGEPHNGPGAPQARPPERSGDRGAPRAKAWGVRGGEAPRVSAGVPLAARIVHSLAAGRVTGR